MKKALKSAEEILEKNGILDPRFEAEQLILKIANCSKTDIMLGAKSLDEAKEKELETALGRRIKGEPLQYIIGEWEFYSLPFFVGEGVLIPRADTEILVDSAIKFLEGKSGKRVIDLCSGSGCIAVAVSKNSPENKVFALEKYDRAFEFLEKNIKRNEAAVTPIKGDVFDGTDERFDLILSNPPYIKPEAMKTLQKEVTFEPETALAGGEDGLIFYRAVIDKWADKLNLGGALMVEIGFDQKEEVMALMEAAGLRNITPKKDINGLWRVIIGTRDALRG